MSELANQLKAERLNRGLTIDEVSAKANISISVIEAIEEGEFEKIGAAILIRSFIRAYCAAMGIDPQPIVDAHAAEIKGYDRQDAGIKQYGRWSKSVYGKKRLGIFPVFMMIIALAGTLYGGMWLWEAQMSEMSLPTIKTGIFPQQELPSDLPEAAAGKVDSAGQKATESVAEQPSGPRAPGAAEPLSGGKGGPPAPEANVFTPRPAEVLPVEPSQTAKKHRFEVEASRKTRIKMIIDKKDAQTVVLNPGEKREWAELESVQIELKNAKGLQMKWDGQPIAPTGKAGQTQRLTLPIPEKPQTPKTP